MSSAGHSGRSPQGTDPGELPWVAVEVPATSANLGPGFDCLGLALTRYDRIEACFTPGSGTHVDVIGEGAGEVATDERNLVARAIRMGLSAFDPSGATTERGLLVRCINTIPHGRGLGSSAAAIVGGLAVAAELLADDGRVEQPTQAQLVALANLIEGHPDNVAAAIHGGATIAWRVAGPPDPDQTASGEDTAGETGGSDASRAAAAHTGPPDVGRAVRLDVHSAVTPILMIPAETAATTRARAALPSHVPHQDAAFNAGRSALLVHALTRDPRLLLPATEDRMHQRQREAVYPASLALVDAMREQLVPAAISGAGPTVIAFAADLPGCVPVPVVLDLMRRKAPADATVSILPVSATGVRAV